ncbi:uncharacterized protein PGTG_07565 [Puccinia graminis f. sp. tritici CRL 75-36-700-3]|uniref:Tyr recombinase domain-containing protein n=1 Tax=Puccinia graminis f. sp. tritici (strain CRL 75-36-700-3 / race SCCL) TaxID=418459 RepID=E3KCL6_PUCGT|nr:uncharacterized protein PGTG_07565 [Puccinia graminis f. sp. tritici CRL 75-36-700-3]EFP82168.2 hypothetical protein PGTG_07565 [Puccinia graminis f. sp. tritici CRL 75-36-700-3]
MELSKIPHFTSTRTTHIPLNWKHKHIISAWSWSTVLSYNAGVKKFLNFITQTSGYFSLPATTKQLFKFCLWAGRTDTAPSTGPITSKTLTKYLFAIQAWHLFHGFTYLMESKAQINLVLKACAKKDTEFNLKKEKTAIHIPQLKVLVELLSKGDKAEKAIANLMLVTFWGMCRMKEVTYSKRQGKLCRTDSIMTSDVSFRRSKTNTIATISLRGAKTAKPGEVQIIKLSSKPNKLCPVAAILRRLEEAGNSDTSLFGFFEEGIRNHITREIAMLKISQITISRAFPGITGHSFRVGGASLRHTLGIPVRHICNLGRWKSDSYKLYIKPYEQEDIDNALILLANNSETLV